MISARLEGWLLFLRLNSTCKWRVLAFCNSQRMPRVRCLPCQNLPGTIDLGKIAKANVECRGSRGLWV